MTVYRADFDTWLAEHAVDAGAHLLTSTVATGLLRDDAGRVVGVRTDRPDGDLRARVVIAADGVNSFLAKEAGLLPGADAAAPHPRRQGRARLAPATYRRTVRAGPREGLDIEMLGFTRGIPGGGFLYTNHDTVSVGACCRCRTWPRPACGPRRSSATSRPIRRSRRTCGARS